MNLAVIAFPGNNCEIETRRAATRNGFQSEIIRWNQPKKIGNFDAYVLPGGFSYEDRGRSGMIAAKQEIFNAIRTEAKKGKLVLGICNGAQMIVESGLISISSNEDRRNPLPFALAHNIRRDQNGKVLGTGFYNSWIYLKPKRKDTAFTNAVDTILHVPIAHGEGRFTTDDDDENNNNSALYALKHGKNVAFRYADKNGNISENFPVTPNGSAFATAAIVNDEGTICAMMPHPERFFDKGDGDQVFISMKKWIEEKRSPNHIEISQLQFSTTSWEKYKPLTTNSVCIEKKQIITDNEAFSVSETASKICGQKILLERSILYEITGNADRSKILESGLILNPNKEVIVKKSKPADNKYGVCYHEDDEADNLAEKLEKMFSGKFEVRILKVWNLKNCSEENAEKILANNLLANPNSAKVYQAI